MNTSKDVGLDEMLRDVRALELALLHRGVEQRRSAEERCACCRRTPLVGERVYLADDGPVLCELCSAGRAGARLQSRVIRGHTERRMIRILDERAA